MRSRPLARRAGVEGFVTAFMELPPLAAGDPAPQVARVLAAKPLDIGLDFSVRPPLRQGGGGGGTVTLGCVLLSETEQEARLALGAFRGARWCCGEQEGATPPPAEALDITRGVWPLKLQRGANVLVIAFSPDETSGWAGVRVFETKAGVRVGLPNGLREDAEAGARPEFTRLNRPGTLQARPGMDHPAWRDELFGKWTALLDGPKESAGKLEVVDETDAGSHTRLRVRIVSSPEALTPAHLLLPKGLKGKAPGVLAVHGHGPGRGRVVGTLPADGHRNYGVLLAERGYVVLAPEIRNFGERKDPLAEAGRYKRDPCDVQFIRGLVTGAWPAQSEAAEWRAWLDALEKLPQVNAERLGVLGLSLGGRTSGLIAALDRRVKAAVVVGALNTMRERVLYGQGCVKYLLPGLLRLADLPDLYALAAPRPLFFELGANDGTSPEIFAQEAYRRLRIVYEAAGAPERLGLHVYDGGHYFNGERSLPWLDEQLKE